MAAVEMLERCAVCPARGLCVPCRPQIVEFGKNVLTVNNLTEVPADFRGIIFPVSQRSGELPITPTRTSGETSFICIKCKKPTSNCTCSSSEVYDLPKVA